MRRVGGQGKPVQAWQTVQGLLPPLRRFLDFVAAAEGAGGEHFELADLEPEHLDAFEQMLVNVYGRDSGRPHAQVMRVVRVLRAVHDGDPDAFEPEFAARLGFTTRHSGPAWTPLNSYPGPVFEAIKAAALADVREIQARILEGEALAGRGEDPGVGGWGRLENVLWHVVHRGPLTAEDSHRRWEVGHRLGGVWRLNSRLYLNAHDLLPFLTLLICVTGLEPSSAQRLRADCLVNPARGFVTIKYTKRRARSEPHKTMRVADGGAAHHPGGLIRLVLRLTQRGRDRIGGDLLWIDHGHQGTRETFAGRRRISINGLHARWLQRHGLDQLTDHDGGPLVLDLRRLRKSFKSQQYLKAAGVLADFAQGHSPQVAARHYADIGAHDELHDRAVENGLAEALQVALPPPVVLDEDGSRLGGDDLEDLPPAQVQAALSGEQDVFLASCRDFHHTPFAAVGKPCPVPMWGCVECPNAVFTTRHLPQVLAFLDFVERQREEMPPAEWQLRYGTAWDRLVHGVRAKFSDVQVRTAQAITEADGSRLLLPPELWETML
ncbi:hypothetical protein [Thermomonospora echinospora]|uniref:hypothetical protein n=1 Tax=Thermomonospora echinospora TaxID=1992 RepID=UPI00190E70B5|nr:hypothetical protein [Thermomonospora echinospora]